MPDPFLHIRTRAESVGRRLHSYTDTGDIHPVPLPDGSYPILPGHPITLAYTIMERYPSLEAASEGIRAADGTICPNAISDPAMLGTEGALLLTLDLLRGIREKRVNPFAVVGVADDFWSSVAHISQVKAGLEQSRRVLDYFLLNVGEWVLAPLPPAEPGDFWGSVYNIKTQALEGAEYIVEAVRFEPALTDEKGQDYFEVFLRSLSGDTESVFVVAK